VVDALTTAIFVLGMWYLARKKIENWMYWIVGNLISIPFFFAQGLAFTSFQFVVFLVLAIMGFFEWKRLYKAGSNPNSSTQ
ncbi:MAG TPA: nicotinamide riboside transporter PnuC, partial [Bacteroidales bacterium]|nr:nicotinamide riboside transporter PnuC [Bacteroidales bacterium]